MWAARIACDEGRYLTELEHDPSGSIRVRALRARVEREPELPLAALRAALLDRSASVRACARYHLTRAEPDFVAPEYYQARLDDASSAEALVAAIAGLAEVGTRDDAALIALHVGSPHSRVAAAAVKACARLAPSDCRAELIAALRDRRSGVSRAARNGLAAAWLDPALLRTLVREAEHTHTRVNALILSERLDRWQRLLHLLEAAANDREPVRTAAQAALARWLEGLNSRHRPLPPSEAQRSRALELLANVGASEVRARVWKALE